MIRTSRDQCALELLGFRFPLNGLPWNWHYCFCYGRICSTSRDSYERLGQSNVMKRMHFLFVDRNWVNRVDGDKFVFGEHQSIIDIHENHLSKHWVTRSKRYCMSFSKFQNSYSARNVKERGALKDVLANSRNAGTWRKTNCFINVSCWYRYLPSAGWSSYLKETHSSRHFPYDKPRFGFSRLNIEWKQSASSLFVGFDVITTRP